MRISYGSLAAISLAVLMAAVTPFSIYHAGNAAMAQPAGSVPINTFAAAGTTNMLTFPVPQPGQLFIMGGDWQLSVAQGNLENFTANIVMVAEDGTRLHVHTIQDLSNITTAASPIGKVNNNQSLSLDADGDIVFSGIADITTGRVVEWRDVPVTISIQNGNVASMIPDPGEVNHFGGLPIYGLVTSFTDGNGRQLQNSTASGDGAGTIHGRDVSQQGQTGAAQNEGIAAIPGIIKLNSTETEIPIVEKLSDEGLYLVQLRWSESPFSTVNGLNYELFFLNPVQPYATGQVLPFQESDSADMNASSLALPYLQVYFKEVGSYDITVYSDTVGVLWQKDNVPTQGGRGFGTITFEEEYAGPVTVDITDIRPDPEFEEDIAVDSVKFTSLVVR